MVLRVWYENETTPHHHKIHSLNITGFDWGWQPVNKTADFNRRPVTFRTHMAMFVLGDVRTLNGTLAVPSFVSLVNGECEIATNALRVIYNVKDG